MSVGAIVTPASWLAEKRRHLTRAYAFDVLPVTIRDTFPAAGKVFSLDRPALYFTAQPTGANHILELALERSINDVIFEGWANGDGPIAYPQCFSVQWWASHTDPTLIDTNTEIGMELFSYGTAPPFAAAPGTGVIQIAQQIKNKDQWRLTAAKGDGVTAAQTVNFTVPFIPAGEGHNVQLIHDPYSLAIYAVVDGVVRATLSGTNVFPRTSADLVGYNTVQAGLFLKTGAFSAGVQVILASWTAAELTSVGTGGPGAVLP